MSLSLKLPCTLIFGSMLVAGTARAQGVRDLTRPDYARDTTVSEAQALDLTLTLTEVSVRALQTWVRTAGTLDANRTLLTTYLSGPEAEHVRVGQRVRAFPPESKSSMYQARVTRIIPQDGRVMVEASIGSAGRESSRYYVMEILAERGQFLSIPNEAIIEEGHMQVAYAEIEPGHFVPREIQTGLQGELYTEILDGLSEGEKVVTFGSFFIDAEYKLNSVTEDTMGDADHNN